MNDHLPINILLIEDSPTVIEMVKFWLEEDMAIPFELMAVVTVTEGLAVLNDQPVDLVILDLNLPDSEGLDTFVKIQSHSNDIPIVIMSGERDEQLALAAMRQGAQDYIVKRSFDGENPLKRPILFALERTRHQQTERERHRAQSQLDVAQAIQQEMLPTRAPEIPGFDVAGRCIPAESVAGDYFDFFPMSSSLWGVLIGDVCGHGLGPALHMIATRGALRALMNTFGDTATITTRTNEIVHQDTRNGRFVTLMFLMLDTDQKTLHYSSAGHPGYLLDAAGNVRQTLVSDQPPLGISEDQDYATYEAPLSHGDVVVLVTDGITETRASDKTQFGEERLFAVIKQQITKPATEIVDEIFTAIQSFRGADVPADDLTVVIVKRLNGEAALD